MSIHSFFKLLVVFCTMKEIKQEKWTPRVHPTRFHQGMTSACCIQKHMSSQQQNYENIPQLLFWLKKHNVPMASADFGRVIKRQMVVVWWCWCGHALKDVIGIRYHDGSQIMVVVFMCWNGYDLNIVIGIGWHVRLQLIVVIWRCWNGYALKNVLGIKIIVWD